MNNDRLNIGVVIIGRNEGLRLVRCLGSLSAFIPQIIYVDSASTDNSIDVATKSGAHVISLDISQGFTAAKARNAGFNTIISLYPSIQYIQFVDGDCIVNSQWIQTAADFLSNNSNVAVACGRRREIFPQHSIYNLMCDQEWDTPIGETKACGGDALIRADILKQLGGYRNGLIAGEEPELCVRIRQLGYKIWRLNSEMTLHDAAITRFSQWWKRTMRGGYAYAEGAYLHGRAPEYHWVKESKRAWVWGFLVPLMILAIFIINPFAGLISLLIYPMQIIRLTLKSRQKIGLGLIQATFLTIGKFAEVVGQVKFWLNHFFGQQTKIIEYK